MRKIFVLLCCLYSPFLRAQSLQRDLPQLRLSAGGTYTCTDLDWSIAGNLQGRQPNVYSELQWKRVKRAGAEVSIELLLGKGWTVEGVLGRSTVFSGQVSDTDYQQDNRQRPAYQARLSSDRGSAHSTGAKLGKAVFVNRLLTLRPYVGYHWLKEGWFLDNQTPDLPDNRYSSYTSKLRGGTFGLLLQGRTFARTLVAVDFQYEQLVFSADANWNAVDAFAHPLSFRHSARGFGLQGRCRIERTISTHLNIFIRGECSRQEMAAGTD